MYQVVQVDDDAYVVGHDADHVADARLPVALPEVEDAVFLGHPRDPHVGMVEQDAVPRLLAGRQRLPA
jgi:hypothetical protein